ncbi:unnamed protein product [Oreochromis niloticus]|nr:unnamed protein product [Mustela putorius furo]
MKVNALHCLLNPIKCSLMLKMNPWMLRVCQTPTKSQYVSKKIQLALTAVGVGVAAAGGVTGASAAIANKVNCNQDQKKIEKIFTDYESLSKGIQEKLVYVHEGIEQLRQYGVIMLERTKVKLERASKVLEFFGQGGPCAKVLEANSKPSGMIEGFALGMDMYFIKGKDGTKVKKGFESKLAKKLRSLAVDLQERLDEFIEMKELFDKYC